MFQLLRFRNLFAVAAILFAMTAAYHAMHMSEGLEGGMRDRPLASAEYRGPVARLEGRLFSPAPLGMEERLRLAVAFEDLKKALEAGSSSHMARFSARELGTLAGMSRGLGDLGGADLDRIRTNWLRVRSNTFDDASWFRFSEADPVAAEHEERTPLGEADRATCAGILAALDRIDVVMARGEREVDRLGEPNPSGSPVSADQMESWRRWGEHWRGDLDGVRLELGHAPSAEAPVPVRAAYDAASTAISQLAAVPGDGGRPPYRVEWSRHFQEAHREVKNARDWIDRAERGVAI